MAFAVCSSACWLDPTGARIDAICAGRFARSIHGSGVCHGRPLGPRAQPDVRDPRLYRRDSLGHRGGCRSCNPPEVQAVSLALADSVSAKDRDEIESRMRNEVLETTAYPEIVFQSTEITATQDRRRVVPAWDRGKTLAAWCHELAPGGLRSCE